MHALNMRLSLLSIISLILAATFSNIVFSTASNRVTPRASKHYFEYPVDILSTFRYEERTYTYNTVDDYLYDFDYYMGREGRGIDTPTLRKVVSGKFDSETLNPTNMVVFTASGPVASLGADTVNYIAFAYHLQGTPVTKPIAEYSCSTSWDVWYDPGAGPQRIIPGVYFSYLAAVATPDAATTFAAVNVAKRHYEGNSVFTYYEGLYVYRYDADSSVWVPAVTMDWSYPSNDNHSGSNDSSLHGFAMAADTGYLWLAMSMKDIKIATIPFSSFATTTVALGIDSSIWITMKEGINPEVELVYDETYNKQIGNPTVRLLYHNKSTENHSGDGYIHSARIEYLYNYSLLKYEPTLTDDRVVYADNPDYDDYRICYNPNDVTGGQKQVFATSMAGPYDARNGYAFRLDARDPEHETWYDLESYSFSTAHAFRHDLTYRANGDRLVVWATNHIGNWNWGSSLSSNCGAFDSILTDAYEPRLATNPKSRQDLVASWYCWYDFNGNTTEEDEGVFLCRELFP